jgi:hypothetical protein
MVMKKLLINPTGLLTEFFNKYQIWKDHKKFYNKDCQESMIEVNSQGIPTFHYTNITGINSSPSPIIAIDCLTEGLHSETIFRRYNKNKHYLIFSNGIWKKDSVDFGISYDIVHHLFCLFDMTDTYLSPGKFCFYTDTNYKFDYPKSCIFTSTVGNVRPERDYFINTLKKKIKYDNFILRYSGEDFGITSTNFDVINFKKGQFDPYTPILKKYYHSVSQSLPINMYNQSYFNIVVETDINYTDNFFLTEKTIKALLTGMPFIIVSTPNFLKNLQQLGFTTYNQLWDEGYDSIVDYKDRIDSIIELCNKLENFDWESNKNILHRIQLENRNNFFNLNQILDREFEHFENIIKQL